MCLVDLRAGRGLRFVQVAAQATVMRLRLRSTLEREVGLCARELGLFAQALSASSSVASRASAAASFSANLRLLFSAADLSRTASVCCVRRRSILPSSRRLSAANSEVRAPDAICSAKAVAWRQKPSNSKSRNNDKLTKSKTTYMLQLLRNRTRHVFSGGGRSDLATGAKLGPWVLRRPLRPSRHGDRPTRHRRWNNSQLPSLRPCTSDPSKTQAPLKKNPPTGPRPVWASNIATPPTR
jgi:hypothetical protein